MKRVLFVNHTGAIGGAENVFLNVLSIALKMKEVEVHVVYPFGKKDSFGKAVKDIGIKRIMRLPYRILENTSLLCIRNLVFSSLSIPILLIYCIVYKIDMIYSNTSVNIIGLLVAMLLRKRHVWHIHEQSTAEYKWIPKFMYRYYRKSFLWKRNLIIFVSLTTQRNWMEQLHCPTCRSIVLYSKYKEIKLRQNIAPDVFTYGFLGILAPNKNVSMLIDCFSELDKGRLLIGGAGKILPALKKQAECSRRKKDIAFLGEVTDLNVFYSKIDALVLPSLNESWGLVAMEAISAQRCVIMTKNTGIREIFFQMNACVFVDPSSKKDIIYAMNEVMNNFEYREALQRNSSLILKKLNINTKFDKKIQEILTVI